LDIFAESFFVKKIQYLMQYIITHTAYNK